MDYKFSLILFSRIIISGICGYLIGIERTNRNKEAGIRTHFIVAMSSALMMIVSKYGFNDIKEYDASRVAAQIVSGVGFLGAGIIFVKKNNFISNLTTAAGIWATAGVGMAIGANLILIGILSTILIILAQIFFHKTNFYSYILNEIIFKLKNPEFKNILNELNKNNFTIKSFSFNENFELKVEIQSNKNINKILNDIIINNKEISENLLEFKII